MVSGGVRKDNPLFYMEKGLFLFGVFAIVRAAFGLNVMGSDDRLLIVAVKMAIALVAVVQFAVLFYGPLLWLEMIRAVPPVMLRLQVARPFLFCTWLFTAPLRVMQPAPGLWLWQKRPLRFGRYVLATLFSPGELPYRLYPLSCCLLE